MFTIKYKNIYIKDYYSIGGVKEKDSNVNQANMYLFDNYYGCKSVEDAEVKMIQTIFEKLAKKNKIDYIVGGNLGNQLAIMHYALKNTNKPFIGVYSACASFIEGLIVASSLLKNDKQALVVTSSHELTCERQFRFPIEYEALKKSYSTTTATSSVGVILSHEGTIRLVSSTIGDISDADIIDSSNMGAVMAYSCAKVLDSHLKSINKSINYYDLVLTGDLGKVGLEILKKYLKTEYNLDGSKIVDAGSILYKEEQNMQSGGSGPAVLPFVFFNKYLQDKKYKRILLIGTGSLHSPLSVNMHYSIPSIAHAISLEVMI